MACLSRCRQGEEGEGVFIRKLEQNHNDFISNQTKALNGKIGFFLHMAAYLPMLPCNLFSISFSQCGLTSVSGKNMARMLERNSYLKDL